MADVKIVDIDSVQWNIKDQVARDKLIEIDEKLIPKRIDDIEITLKSGYSASMSKILDIVKYGKLYTGAVRITNIEGSNIGTAKTAIIGTIPIKPIADAFAIGIEYTTGSLIRALIKKDGEFYIAESLGVRAGNNVMVAQIYWIEP